MRGIRPLTSAAAVVAALLAIASSACAGRKAADAGPNAPPQAAAAHPQVDTGLQTCAECHAEATPQIHAQWNEGRHGLAGVKCVVCHGSTGADFRARPGAAGCRGCHAAQAVAASGARADAAVRADCFSCHPPHLLAAKGKQNPHPSASR